ncbi:hypothetical protein [Luteibacter sp. 9135]|uniref:hypothetical protein n=1 Tax=Luteibacter sp. 9135 TaxID=1500893 RepID=UPI000B1C7D91|nr:hypothetical protein [Luteibacter sp. 9135]
MKISYTRAMLALALSMLATTACTRHNDSDTAVPGANTAGTGTAATPPAASTSARGR